VPLAGYHAPIKKWVEDFSRVTGKKAVLERIPDDKAASEEWGRVRWSPRAYSSQMLLIL
jgi:hypothetical protein